MDARTVLLNRRQIGHLPPPRIFGKHKLKKEKEILTKNYNFFLNNIFICLECSRARRKIEKVGKFIPVTGRGGL
jgi:hypothetical protein